jgi:hypothetical protein
MSTAPKLAKRQPSLFDPVGLDEIIEPSKQSGQPDSFTASPTVLPPAAKAPSRVWGQVPHPSPPVT